jgi:hypothetical protein
MRLSRPLPGRPATLPLLVTKDLPPIPAAEQDDGSPSEDEGLSDSDTLINSGVSPSPTTLYFSVRGSILTVDVADLSTLEEERPALRPSRSCSLTLGRDAQAGPQRERRASEPGVRYSQSSNASTATLFSVSANAAAALAAAPSTENLKAATIAVTTANSLDTQPVPRSSPTSRQANVLWCSDTHAVDAAGNLTRAALDQLIAYLTAAHNHPDDKMLAKFFWGNIRLEVGSQACLDVVRELYRARIAAGDEASEAFALRLAAQLHGWIAHGWKAGADDAVAGELLAFINDEIALRHPETAGELIRALDATLAAPPQWPSRTLMYQHLAQPTFLPPTAFVFTGTRGASPFLLSFDTPDGRMEFARQLTLLCSDAWRELIPGDLWCAWFFRGDSGGGTVPEQKCLDIFNRLRAWVAMTVHEASDERACLETTEFWIGVAKASNYWTSLELDDLWP